MTEQMYCQCRLRKGNYQTVTYIQQSGAKVGYKVQLLTLGGKFWEVISAGPPVPKSQVKESERAHKSFKVGTKSGGIG